MIKILLPFISLLFIIESTYARKAEELLKKSKTTISNPLQLRDPFKRPALKRKSKLKSRELDKTYFSNVATIDQTPLDRIKITGILLGRERRAIAVVIGQDGSQGKESFILKEGMTLGENKAEIKAILPGGLVLVEKITNVYDEEEYLETIIPVSSD